MIQAITQSDQFKQQLSYSLQQETLHAPTTTIAKNAHVYRCGELDQTVYFIESGQIKLLMRSPEEREPLRPRRTSEGEVGRSEASR